MFQRFVSYGATLFLAVTLLIAPSAPIGAQANNGLTEADTSDAVSFHPYLTTDSPSSSYQGLVYAAGLMRRNPDTLKPEPLMATEWTVSDDGLVYTFKLREDMKWSDGQPITSSDFKFTYDRAQDPANEYPYRENFDFIASYEAPDPYTIVVTIKEPFCPALEGVDAVQPLPKHIWENLDWKDPQTNPEIMKPSVASGPFKLQEWVKDDHVVFVANDSYFQGRPKLDTYTIRIVPEQSIAYTMLKSGEVDMTGITPEQYDEAKADPNLQMYEWWRAAGNWNYVGFNLRKPYLQDVKVRHALVHSINRQQIVDKILRGLARPINGPIPPTNEYYTDDVPKFEFSPEKARQLLTEAGWAQGSGGWEKDGQALKLRLIYGPNTSKTAEQIAIVTQAQMKDIGIDVEIQGFEWGAYLEALKAEPFDWDLNVGAWNATLDPYWMHQVFTDKFIPDLNHVDYRSDKVKELFERSGRECDNRKAVFAEIQQTIAEDSPYIFVSESLSYVPINKRVGGIKPTPLGIGYNIEQWFIQGQQ